ARARGLPAAVWGAAVAHAGMGVTVAGIAGMSLAANTIVAVRPGHAVDLGGYTWTLRDIHDGRGSNYTARIADIDVTRDGRPVVSMHPSRRSFPTQQQNTTDVAIHTTGFYDLYAVLGEERGNEAVLRLHVNPLAPEIWFGALIMAAGGILSLSDRRLRIGAPARRAARAG
ncbi:cytochrome c-type biogenesis CcmF C-terminal domain-containing protein, partial [Acidisphaera rubrifaciens]|uniref:cytochrome c-type biogenesis CcmF C-terminal domain-containing protein n=1 Tax=Acidisphaera rubrifaciens TaxID=50715 RepID=UPI00066261D8